MRSLPTHLVLLGHNGAGKTTLLSYLLGFYTHTDQHPYLPTLAKGIAPLDTKTVGYAPEAARLEGSLSGDEYLKMQAMLRGVAAPKATDAFAQVGLQADRDMPLSRYSKGMRQRLLLALALVGSPSTLVLDEPTSGLDPFGRNAIGDLLIDLAKGHRMILSTHDLDLAARFGGTVWILHEGAYAYQGIPTSKAQLEVTFFAHPVTGESL